MKSMIFVCLILLSVLTQLITNYLKKNNYGLNGTELLWLKNHLNERTQGVTISGKISYTKFIGKGVPQGSILGPQLFTILILPMIFHHVSPLPSVIFLLVICVSDKSITKIQQILQNVVNGLDKLSYL